MKRLMLLIFLLKAGSGMGQNSVVTLRSVLTDQMESTHHKTGWFVPVNVALEGLTPEQAMWTDGSGNHSAGQLAYHLLFWNERQLLNFKGLKAPEFSGNNEETFNKFDKKSWTETVSKLDAVMKDLEGIIQKADETKLKEWAATIANINTHNAYHTGQIIFVRKLQGSWNPEKGVK